MEVVKNLFAIISGANLEPTFDLFANFLPIYTLPKMSLVIK